MVEKTVKRRIGLSIVGATIVLLAALFGVDASARPADPIKLTLCQLLSDPGRYNHAMVEVSGYVEHAFEDFSMPLENCPSQKGMGMGLWLDYGGTQKSQTKYCCVNDIGADRTEPLVVEGITCNLIADASFDRFKDLLMQRGSTAVTATLVGRFFAGELMSFGPRASFWGGYGHMGSFSLLVIERVRDVQPAVYVRTNEPPARESTVPLPPTDPRTVEP
nr:hypothetical protein [Luteibacter rhizovicinus]